MNTCYGMKRSEDFTFCCKFINEFIGKYLKGNIYALLDFDVASLRHDNRFGCNSRGFDCDDTNLTRAICFLLWGEAYPDITLYDIGTGKKYRGDTLNTFRTVLGAYQTERLSCVGVEKSNAPEYLRVLANQFYNAYRSIGNFILLPNIAETDNKRAFTLNTYRGTAYKDYFDLFMQNLDLCLTSVNGDEHLAALVKRNDFFFSWLQTNGGLKYFCKLCWLDDYFTDGKPKRVFSPYVHCLRKRREWTDFEKANYIEYIGGYLITATAIIKNRAIKMIEQLAVKCHN